MIGRLPTSESIGRTYELIDAETGATARATMLACWPDRGPTWSVRLHELGTDGRLVTVWLYEEPRSKLGRWYVTREVPSSKPERYRQLVETRKGYDSRSALQLLNPSMVDEGRFDSDEIGPWTRWAGDLDAEMMIVGQDWGDVRYFETNRGFDNPGNPTNVALAQLLASIGIQLPEPPTAEMPASVGTGSRSGVFLTNALLWLKDGGMSSTVNPEWFKGDAGAFLLEQIAIVRPRVVVALGQRSYSAIVQAYDLPQPKRAFREVVEMVQGIVIPGLPGTSLFGVYHCGARIRNTTRPLALQFRDWARIARALGRVPALPV